MVIWPPSLMHAMFLFLLLTLPSSSSPRTFPPGQQQNVSAFTLERQPPDPGISLKLLATIATSSTSTTPSSVLTKPFSKPSLSTSKTTSSKSIDIVSTTTYLAWPSPTDESKQATTTTSTTITLITRKTSTPSSLQASTPSSPATDGSVSAMTSRLAEVSLAFAPTVPERPGGELRYDQTALISSSSTTVGLVLEDAFKSEDPDIFIPTEQPSQSDGGSEALEKAKKSDKGIIEEDKEGEKHRRPAPSPVPVLPPLTLPPLPVGLGSVRSPSYAARYRKNRAKSTLASTTSTPKPHISSTSRPTILDPISAILESVVVVDVSRYLPKGYRLPEKGEGKRGEENYEEEGGELGNINDLLREPEHRQAVRRPVFRRDEDFEGDIQKAAFSLGFEANTITPAPVGFRLGKVKGQALAAIARELADVQAGDRGSKVEEEVIPQRVVEEKISDQSKFVKEGFQAHMIGQEEVAVDKFVKETDAKAKSSGFQEALDASAQDIFAAIYSGGELTLGSSTLAAPASSATTTTSLPTTLRSRSSTSLATPLGWCSEVCRLAGTLALTSVEWSEALRHPFTTQYKQLAGEVVAALTTTFTQAYFGRALDYVQVEAFDQRRGDAGVLVDIFLKFSGLAYNLSTANLKEALEEGLEEGGGLLEGSGTFLKVDPSRSYFLVTDTQLQKQAVVYSQYGLSMPDWAWLVLMAGLLSLSIIAASGCVVGCRRSRHSRTLARSVLNPRTLDAFKNSMHFEEVEVDSSTAYLHDKRDMWTLQKQRTRTLSRSQLDSRLKARSSSRASSLDSNSMVMQRQSTMNRKLSGRASVQGWVNHGFGDRHPAGRRQGLVNPGYISETEDEGSAGDPDTIYERIRSPAFWETQDGGVHCGHLCHQEVQLDGDLLLLEQEEEGDSEGSSVEL